MTNQKSSKRKRRNTEADLEIVKNAISNAIRVLGVVSKSQVTDDDINVRVIGQFNEEARDAWEALPTLEAKSMYAYANQQRVSDKHLFLADLAKNVDAAIIESEATRQEYKSYKMEVQDWKHEMALKAGQNSCPKMSPESLIVSSLDDVEAITALFSRNLKATNPDILSCYDSKTREEVLTDYWGRAAKNLVLRMAQDILEIWAKEDKTTNKEVTDVYKKRGHLDSQIINVSLDDLQGMIQKLIGKGAASRKLSSSQYQGLFPPSALVHKRDKLAFFVPAARDLTLHPHNRKVKSGNTTKATPSRYTTLL